MGVLEYVYHPENGAIIADMG